MKFDFSEEEIDSMYGLYASALESVHNSTKEVVEQLQARASDLKYEPVIKLTVDAVNFYNQGIKEAEEAALGDWQESSLSFASLIDTMNAGENAKIRSKDLEGDIADEIQSWKTIDSDTLANIDTTNWKCDESDFEEIGRIVKSFIGGLDDLAKQHQASIERAKSENGIYVSIEPVVLQSITIVSAGFEQGVRKSFEKLAQEFEKNANKVAQASSQSSQNAASQSAKFVSSSVSALNDRVKSIWN